MGKKRRKAAKRKHETRGYEAAMSTPSRRHVIGANQSPDTSTDSALGNVREWGRYLDENSDVAHGILDELVASVVGRGIVTIPKPLNADGSMLAVAHADEGEPAADLWDVVKGRKTVTQKSNCPALQACPQRKGVWV